MLCLYFNYRLAVPDHNYMSNVLGVKNGVHRQKISVKAMDLVLFGPPKGRILITISWSIIFSLFIQITFAMILFRETNLMLFIFMSYELHYSFEQNLS